MMWDWLKNDLKFYKILSKSNFQTKQSVTSITVFSFVSESQCVLVIKVHVHESSSLGLINTCLLLKHTTLSSQVSSVI